MQILDYINANESQIKLMIRNGLTDAKILMYRDIYYQFKALTKTRINYTDAANQTAVLFEVSQRTVYRAKSMMEKKVIDENRRTRSNSR